MKRIAISLLAPFAALYVMIAFTTWSPAFDPGTWEESSRAMFLLLYVWAAGSLYVAWPS